MSRLFTFGCSFTNYRWTTWADIIAHKFDHHYNWAQSGAGNQFIFNSVMEADQRHRFGQGDTVLICWTSLLREDRYTERWQTLGNVLDNAMYTKDYQNQITARGCLIRDIACVKAVKDILINRRRLHWQFFSIHNWNKWDLYDNDIDHCQDVFSVYKDTLSYMGPNFSDMLFNGQWPNRIDPHPTPLEHLEFVDKVFPSWVTDSTIRAKIQEETKNLNKTRSGLSTVTRF